MAQMQQFTPPGGEPLPPPPAQQRPDGRKLLSALALVLFFVVVLVTLYGYSSGAAWAGMWDYTYDGAGAVTAVSFRTFWDWLSLLIMPVVLLLGGGLLGRYLERGRERTAWSTKVAEEYLKRFDDHAEVTAVLRQPEAGLTDQQKLAVLRFGNWLEFVATLYNRDMLDRDLFHDLGFFSVICLFYAQTEPYNFVADARTVYWENIIALCRT